MNTILNRSRNDYLLYLIVTSWSLQWNMNVLWVCFMWSSFKDFCLCVFFGSESWQSRSTSVNYCLQQLLLIAQTSVAVPTMSCGEEPKSIILSMWLWNNTCPHTNCPLLWICAWKVKQLKCLFDNVPQIYIYPSAKYAYPLEDHMWQEPVPADFEQEPVNCTADTRTETTIHARLTDN